MQTRHRITAFAAIGAVYAMSGRYQDQLAFEAAGGRFERATADYGSSRGSVGRSEGVYAERIQAAWTDVRAAHSVSR